MSQRKDNSGIDGRSGKNRTSRKNQAPPEGFADFMDLGADQAVEAPVAAPKSPVTVPPTEDAGEAPAYEMPQAMVEARNYQKQRGNQTPAWAWGMLPAACTLIVGVGLFSALTFLFNGSPAQLWDFSGLTQLEGLYDLNQHPQHVFFAVLLGSVLLLGMVGYRLASVIGDLDERLASQGELLSRLTSLRLSNQEAWTDPLFKIRPEVEGFTAEVLGAWRHMEARLGRVVGLEGELHRLEKALSEDATEDLGGRYEVPVIGMIADEIMQIHAAKDAAQEEVESLKARLGSKGHDLMGDLQDARSWQRFTLDQLNLQGDAVQKVAGHLQAAGAQLAGASGQGWDPEVAGRLLADLKAALTRGSGATDGSGSGVDADLLERLAKLSFQIGMEVARLGKRGERLAPMAQTLEELTRAIRQQSGGQTAAAPSGAEDSTPLLARLEEQVEALKAAGTGPAHDLPETVRKLGRAAGDAAGNLVKIADSFESQYERLGRIGIVCAELTDVPFDTAGTGNGAGGRDLQLTPLDPFLKQEPAKVVPAPDASSAPVPEVDPFLARQDPFSVRDNGPDPFGTADVIQPDRGGLSFGSEPEAPGIGLSTDEDRVYDMHELGGKLLPPEDDRIYDLAEFGAVRISEPLPKAVGDDRIYDLSEFGARRLD